jgi:hypothetical protein
MSGPGVPHRAITSRPAGAGTWRSDEEEIAAFRAICPAVQGIGPAVPGSAAVGILGLSGLEERRASAA